jgi:hypothetical protein
MTRGSKIWLAVAGFLAITNIGGAAYAIALDEVGHALVHVALAVAGGAWMWALLARSRRRAVVAPGGEQARIDYLQQSVDAMAIELERLGEVQRFQEKLRSAAKDGQ